MHNQKLNLRNNLLALLTSFSVFVSYAQNTFRINYDAASFDLPVNSTEALTANNYVFSGFHTNFVPIRSSMTEVDNAGNIVWSKMYSDGSLSYMFGDFKRDAALSQYYACGGSNNGPAFILFLDNTGNVVSGRRFSIAQADGAFFNKIIKTSDGGYLCVGYVIGHDPDGSGPEPKFSPVTNSDPSCSSPVTEHISSPLIAKFDASGVHQWHRVFRYYNTSSAPIYNDAEFVDVSESADGYMAIGNYKVNDVFASYDSNCEDNVPTDAMLVKFNTSGGIDYHVQIDLPNNSVSQSSKSFNSISGNIALGFKFISGNDNAGGTTRPCLLMRVDGNGSSWPGPDWIRRYGGGILIPFVGPYYPIIPSRFFRASDGNYVVWANYLETSVPPSFSNLLFKINPSNNSVIWARKHTFNMASILPYGEEVSDGGFIGLSYNLTGTGHDMHFIKTDNTGQAPSSCAATDVSMSSDAPSYTFVSPIYNSWTTGTVTNTSLTPVVTNITPPRNVVCFQAPCVPPPAPTVDASPNPICAGQTVTISASGGGTGVGYNVYTVPSGGTSLGTTPLNVNPTSTTTYYVESYEIANPTCVSTTRTAVTVTVNPDNTATGPGSATVCVNTAITPAITHTTTGATGIGTPSGLPPGVNASWSSNTLTISGTPTSTGTFNYSIPLTGGCGSVNVTGTITVISVNTVTGPNDVDVCVNQAITPITHTTTGATGIGTPSGLPPGVSATFASNTITISGIPTSTGTYNYSIPLTGGCGTVNATGTITVNGNNTVTGPGSATVCVNTAITPAITHTTTGATGIGTPSGLPPGVTASFASNTITISGTPTTAGTYNYSIPLTGGCGTINATGTITVNPDNSYTGTTDQTVCVNSAMTPLNITTSGVTGIGSPTGLPNGVSASWSSGTISITGTPSDPGVYNYSIPLTGGCGTVNVTGTITVLNENQYTPPPVTYACINQPLSPNLIIPTQGATGIGSPTNLPPGMSASFVGNDVVISGTPTSAGIYNYSIPLTGGCASVNINGTIEVIIVNSYSGNTNISACVNQSFLDSIAVMGPNGIGTPTGLPTGVIAYFSNGYVYIQGPATNVGSFNYSIPLTGGCGTVDITGTININPDNTIVLTSAPLTDVQDLCLGNSITTITYQVTGATGVLFNNVPSGIISNYDINNQEITISGTPTESGVYNYTIELTGGCGTITTNGTITIYENPVPQLTSNSPVCIGENAQLNVTSNGTPLSYQWFSPNGNLIGNTSTVQINSISEEDTGYYQVVVTVGGMCTTTDSIYIAVTTPLDPVISLVSLSPLCENDGFTFAVSGISGANYQWTSPQGTQYSNNMPDITNADLSDEGYWVLMVNNGCIAYDSIYVDVNPLPSPSLSYVSNICPDETIQIVASGGVSYQWQGPNGFSSTDSLVSIPNPTINDYGWFIFTITGTNGCSLTDSVSITPLTVSIEANPDTATTDPETEITIAVLPNDVASAGNITIVSSPQYGSATVVNNQILYTPNSGFAGNDTLVYMVCDLNCQLVCDTAWVRIYVYADVMVPELVTPNGDGSNDTWVINGLDKYPDHEVIIMNRWGDKIFVAKPYNNDWNGQTNVGILMGNEGKTTDGTYFYIINLSQDAQPIKGFLELRK